MNRNKVSNVALIILKSWSCLQSLFFLFIVFPFVKIFGMFSYINPVPVSLSAILLVIKINSSPTTDWNSPIAVA